MSNKLIALEKESTGISENLRNLSNVSEKSYLWTIMIVIYLGYQFFSQQN